MKEVYCDFCGDEFTNSKEKGGFLFHRKAGCASCEKRLMPVIEEHKEERYIVDRCGEDETFKDFVYRIRKINTFMKVFT